MDQDKTVAPLRHQSGVTLIELAITIVVLAVLATLAAPSFTAFLQRQAIKGAAENIVSVIAQAKEEATKRDREVRVEFSPLGEGVCAGAILGSTACDCSDSACPLASSAQSERDLKGVTLSGDIKFGDGTGFTIDPKTGTLVDFGETGSVQLETSLGYTIQVNVNAMARASVCNPSDEKALPGVKPCA